jgi:hypothetical protein
MDDLVLLYGAEAIDRNEAESCDQSTYLGIDFRKSRVAEMVESIS